MMSLLIKISIIFFMLSSSSLYAMRLASTSPAITQTLISLGLSDHIIGISTYCRHDKDVARIGTAFSINWEKLLTLRPTYLLTQKVRKSSNLSKAKKLNIKVKEYDFSNLQTLRESILSLGESFTENKKLMSKAIVELDKNIELIKKIKFKKKVLGLVGLNQKLGEIVSVSAIGKENYYDDLFNLSSVESVIKRKGYRALSIEQVLKLDIDYIFIFSPGISKETELKLKKITGKKIVTWRDFESQEVGTLFITFMRSYYEKLSSQM